MMATKITKWTRERGGRKDFVDPTRRSHQALTYHLSERENSRMKELAEYDKSQETVEKYKKIEGKEDAVVRKRIAKLRAQLHNFSIGENNKIVADASSPEREEPPKSVKELKEESRRRKDLLRTARSYIPAKVQPITPKQRGQRIHTKVIAHRAIQVKEKEDRIKAREKEDEKWAHRVVQNQHRYEEDRWREILEKEEKKEKIKRDLDELCEERIVLRNADKDDWLQIRKGIELSDELHAQHQTHWFKESNKKKLLNREKALKEIQDINDRKLQEAIKEEELKEDDLKYSAFKRAYARRVKQRIIDKMHGRRPEFNV